MRPVPLPPLRASRIRFSRGASCSQRFPRSQGRRRQASVPEGRVMRVQGSGEGDVEVLEVASRNVRGRDVLLGRRLRVGSRRTRVGPRPRHRSDDATGGGFPTPRQAVQLRPDHPARPARSGRTEVAADSSTPAPRPPRRARLSASLAGPELRPSRRPFSPFPASCSRLPTLPLTARLPPLPLTARPTCIRLVLSSRLRDVAGVPSRGAAFQPPGDIAQPRSGDRM